MLLTSSHPPHAEDYVHRIGRTGRAGATGTSYSFFTAANGRLAREIIKVMSEANQEVPPALQQLAATSGGGGSSSELAAYAQRLLPLAYLLCGKLCAWNAPHNMSLPLPLLADFRGRGGGGGRRW